MTEQTPRSFLLLSAEGDDNVVIPQERKKLIKRNGIISKNKTKKGDRNYYYEMREFQKPKRHLHLLNVPNGEVSSALSKSRKKCTYNSISSINLDSRDYNPQILNQWISQQKKRKEQTNTTHKLQKHDQILIDSQSFFRIKPLFIRRRTSRSRRFWFLYFS